MRQVFLQKGNVHLFETPIPLENEHNIVVQVHYSFISTGTEGATLVASGKTLFGKFTADANNHAQKVLGAIKENGLAGTIALIKDKINQVMPLGYSCAGQVIHVGRKVKNFRIGDYVACAGAAFAQHADVVTVPENLAVMVNNSKLLKQASLTTIGAIAMQGMRRANLQFGETVCVIGLGLIGQITVQLAKIAGCKVIAIDLVESKLKLAKKFGADKTLNALTQDIAQEITFATHHRGADATIITASSNSGSIIQQSMNITRRKGKVVLVGDVKIDFDRDPFYSKEIDFLISCSYGPGRYDKSYEVDGIDYPYDYVRWTENRNMALFLDLLESKKISVDPLINHEFDLNNVEQAYGCLQKRNALGIVLSYSPTKINYYEHVKRYQETETEITPFATIKKKIKVGMVGAGGFAKVKLMPIISKIKNTHIHSIVDLNAPGCINLARQYHAHRINNDYRKLLSDDDVNLVVISTPHAGHARQTIDCLKAGKAVFCEKPAGVSEEQLNELKQFFKHHKDVLYCADFNRSFSPMMKRVKKLLDTRTGSTLINYRMNAGYLPPDHWIESDEHRGRIIGEACHIFELFLFLTDSHAASISVSVLNSPNQHIQARNNFSAAITMTDGSCCTLTYTDIGHSNLGKEYMELFVDGKSVMMNDFYSLKGYGLPLAFNLETPYQDKGHEALINEFFTAARTPHSIAPIPTERILETTEISLIIDRLVTQGGGFEYLSVQESTYKK